jgi:hypothetical protein
MGHAPSVFSEPVNQATTWLREISAVMGGWMPDDYALQALRAALLAPLLAGPDDLHRTPEVEP